MMNGYFPVFIVFIAFILSFFGNYCLQTRLIKVTSKERAIDFLLKKLEQLNELYNQYWQEPHSADRAVRIKINQTQLYNFLTFTHKKYIMKNQLKVDIYFEDIIMEAINEDFDSPDRQKPRFDKCTQVSKLTNRLHLILLENKI